MTFLQPTFIYYFRKTGPRFTFLKLLKKYSLCLMVYICEECNYSTKRLANYNIHIKSDKHLNNKNDDVQFKYVCDGCKYKTDKKINYSRHLQSGKHLKISPDIEIFHCKPCDYKTDKLINYNKHLETKKHQIIDGENSDKVYKCEECNFFSDKRFDYNRHLITKKHKSRQGSLSSDITPSGSVASLTSIEDFESDECLDENERMPVKNEITGEVRYSSNAPKRKNLKNWLETHKDWTIHMYTKRATKNEQIVQLLKRVIGIIEESI